MSEIPDTVERVECRYIGAYGKGHHRAYVSGVGEVHYGELVKMTKAQFKKLPKHEWVSAENLCVHVGMNSELCWEERVEGSLYCNLHIQEFQDRAQLKDKLPVAEKLETKNLE